MKSKNKINKIIGFKLVVVFHGGVNSKGKILRFSIEVVPERLSSNLLDGRKCVVYTRRSSVIVYNISVSLFLMLVFFFLFAGMKKVHREKNRHLR